MNFITGERIQQLCDVYCGTESDFSIYNRERSAKNIDLDTIQNIWDNPTKIFCYSDRITLLQEKLHYFKNPFILITHNSDVNISEEFKSLLESPKILFWHAQNVMMYHHKLGGLPIGIANSTWGHGNLSILESVCAKNIQKTNSVYFYFSIHTNYVERSECYKTLIAKGLDFGQSKPFETYLETLASYKYAICPPGNGVDCHRIWECYYLGVIPIVKRSVFTEKLSKSFPCILLDTWNNFDESLLHYTPINSMKLDMTYIKECIEKSLDWF